MKLDLHTSASQLKTRPEGSGHTTKSEPSRDQNTPTTPTNFSEQCYDNFCETYCCRDPYHFTVDPCLADRPPWTNYSSAGGDSCSRHAHTFQERLAHYLNPSGEGRKCSKDFHPTQFIVDDKYYLFPPAKAPQKRPLWGVPSTQWDIDLVNGKREYRKPNFDAPRTPLPTFFQPLSAKLAETCLIDDKEIGDRHPTPILRCASPYCARKYSRGTHRDYRGKHPKGTAMNDEPNANDPFIKKLMQEAQLLFDEFLSRKVPIIWIYGRPQQAVAAIRRKYCLSLAETHGFTYISLDEEIAMLAAKGSRAIQAGNPYFEGFSAIERLALPVCIKLVTDRKYTLNRPQALEMLKYLMLQYFPTKGYIIDGFPLDSTDNEDFEKTFYPVACGLYFLDADWTTNKSQLPEIYPALYFKRDLSYNENDVEEACGNFGLKTLKIIGAETLLDDEEKIFALHSVVDEYLDAYDEVLEGNEDVLRDENLEFQTFGETVGYGVDLAEYIKRRQLKVTEEEKQQQQDGVGDGGEPRRLFLELDKLKEMGWEGTKELGAYSSAMFDLNKLKVTPSQRHIIPDEDEDEEDEDYELCAEDDEECLEKEREHRNHRCRCRCKSCSCNRKYKGQGRGWGSDASDDDDDDNDASDDDSNASDDSGASYNDSEVSDNNHSDRGDKVEGRRRGRHKSGKSKEKKKERGKRTPSQTAGSESEVDEEMDAGGPFRYVSYDKRWGFKRSKKLGKKPTVQTLHTRKTPSRTTEFKKTEDKINRETKEEVTAYTLPRMQSHNIPDPYNTPSPSAPDIFSKSRASKAESEAADVLSAAALYTEEPTSRLKSLFSDSMSRVMAQNQADIRKIKYDKLKKKVGQVEYEIYQDDYRSPKYRFYKKYQDYTPEDFIKEKENHVPCANCFDSFKQADQYNKGEQVLNLSNLEHKRAEEQAEIEHQYGKGPLFNRIISCLCGEDNEAGFTNPGYKPEAKLEDNTDLDHFDETPDYRKKKK